MQNQKSRVPRSKFDLRQVIVTESEEYLDEKLDEPDYIDDGDNGKK